MVGADEGVDGPESAGRTELIARGMSAVSADGDQLLHDAQQGDDDARGLLVRREWPTVFAIVSAGTRNRFEAEELTQEVFARVFAHLSTYRAGGAPFRAYVAQIARNLLRDRWRQQRSRPSAEDELLERADDCPGPEAQVLGAFDRDALIVALARMPADHRQVIRMRLYERRTTEEVALVLGRSTDAVRQLQHRALARLRREYLVDTRPDVEGAEGRGGSERG